MGNLFRVIRLVLLVKSFAFGLLVAALWVRSSGIADRLSLDMPGQSSSLISAAGAIIYHAIATGQDHADLRSARRSYQRLDPEAVVRTLPDGEATIDGWGFSFHKQPLTDTHGIDLTVTFPHWLLFLLGSAEAIVWTIRKLLRKATADGVTTAGIAKPARVLGWCGRCQCQQYSVNYRCLRCNSTVCTQ